MESSLSPEHSASPDSQLLDILRLLYGFVPLLPLPDRAPGECTPVERCNTLAITGILGAQHNPALLKTPIAHLCINFLRHFWQVPPIKPPTESWDLHPSNRLFAMTSLRIHTIQTLTSSSGECLYMFDFGDLLTVPWKLTVHSASVALLICRLPDSLVDERDIVTYLLENGIKFRTMRQSQDLASAPQEFHAPVPAHIRVATDQFTSIDYEFYKQDIAALLKQRHGRAALLGGGLLWRIAKDILSFSEALEGPVARYPAGQTMFSAVDSKGTEYVDDELTQDERNLLCRLYIKFTGECNSKVNCSTFSCIPTIPGYGDQQTKVSWFPLAETWEEGGLHQIRWSSQNEEWFTKHIASVGKGDATSKPLGLKNWHDNLRGLKDARNTRMQLERWSQEELGKHLTSMQ